MTTVAATCAFIVCEAQGGVFGATHVGATTGYAHLTSKAVLKPKPRSILTTFSDARTRNKGDGAIFHFFVNQAVDIKLAKFIVEAEVGVDTTKAKKTAAQNFTTVGVGTTNARQTVTLSPSVNFALSGILHAKAFDTKFGLFALYTRLGVGNSFLRVQHTQGLMQPNEAAQKA